MRSSKSRSRSKSNRNRSIGNVVNRVFDSSGPEGKVRGTPQQIIEKYNQLARDAQLSNDRVAAENFQQHAEHYTRMLGEAMREQEARMHQQGGPQQGGQDQGGPRDSRREDHDERRRYDEPREDQDQDQRRDDVIDMAGDDEGTLVETPESAPAEQPEAQAPRPPRRRRPRKGADAGGEGPEVKPEAAE